MTLCVPADNRAENLTKDGMLKGIQEAAAFILFLSNGVMGRVYCQMEIREALRLKKPILCIHGKRSTETCSDATVLHSSKQKVTCGMALLTSAQPMQKLQVSPNHYRRILGHYSSNLIPVL